MPSEKRQRQKAGRAARQEAIRAAEKRRARQRQVVVFVGIVAVTVGLLFLLGILGGDDDKTDLATTPEQTGNAAKCPSPNNQDRRTSFAAPQQSCTNKNKSYTAVVETDVGTFKILLDMKRSPTTVNNFVVLARYKFYDGLTFHRVVKDFVIQGGDPEGTGAGGPGYKFPDENLAGTKYPAGSVAMANSGSNTNGSQFFIVLTDSGGQGLEPKYNRFGTVIEGMDVVKKIEADPGVVGTQTPPATVHKIIKITIEER